MGKALYRKYRPTTLDDVVCQEEIVNSLKSQLKSGKISHAYIFAGPRGCGKTSVARIFAHEVNKFKYNLEDSYVDIVEIDAASNNGVDNVRDLREKTLIAPSEGKYKVYIFDEAHMLSISAANALLKILEEPPEHVIFILATTNPDKLPITILSRAEVYTFKLASSDVMKAHLRKISDQEKIKISNEALDIIVERGGGSFRDSISLLDQISNLSDGKTEIDAKTIEKALGLPSEKKIAKLLDLYESGTLDEVPETLKDLINSGVSAENLANSLIERISAHPSQTSLNLITRLFNVVPPFADAKLLVAFLGDGSVPSRNITSTTVTTTVSSQKEQIQTAKNSVPSVEKTVSQIEKVTTTVAKTTSSDFNLVDFITAVHEDLPAHATRLQKSHFVTTQDCINIYPTSRIDYRILSSASNLDALIKKAGINVIIHDPTEESTPKNAVLPGQAPKNAQDSAQLDEISAIMGGNVEEVTDAQI